MSRPLAATGLAALCALAVGAAFAACDNPFALPPAISIPKDTTYTLFSMTGTPVFEPSAYDMVDSQVVRTDRTTYFDFVLDMPDSLGDTIPLLLPPGALGLPRDGGLQISKTPFDSLNYAPDGGYDQAVGQRLALGTVLLASSRTQSCNYNIAHPVYAKLQVLAIDTGARSVTFHMVLDDNCGYRSLLADSVPPTN
ncbi:MAG: hypothetical protein ABSG61_14470 [Gemmatimonadales bacterium]|jgi:hypothetical protein